MKTVVLTMHGIAFKSGDAIGCLVKRSLSRCHRRQQSKQNIKKQPGHFLVPSVVSTDVQMWRGATRPPSEYSGIY